MEKVCLSENPLVSICMPAYNAEKYIQAAVNSIIQQTYENWELIIVDDGSVDKTKEIISKFTDPRIKVFSQPNGGQCAAANQAFHHSGGTLIKFFDADDLMSPKMIESQVSVLYQQTNTIAFGTWGRFYGDDLKHFETDKDFITEDSQPFNWLISSMTGRQVMLQCALWLIPREILYRAGLWNEKLSLINDFEFIIRVLLCADWLKFSPDAILYYRSGLERSLSGTKSPSSVESAYNSIDWGTQHLLDYSESAQVRRIAADCFQRFVYSYYPEHMALVHRAIQRISALGGATVAFEAGGYTKILTRIFGWKLIKWLKYRLGNE